MKQDTDQGLEKGVLRPFRRSAFGVAIFTAAMIVWATAAQLATTVLVSGTLVSSQPRYELQHPYGGKIQSVLVEQQQQLRKGQAVFELDVTLQKQSLAEIETQITFLNEENKLIDLILSGQFTPGTISAEAASPTHNYYTTKLTQFSLNLDNNDRAVKSLTSQTELREVSLALLRERRVKTRKRLTDIETLAAKGVTTQAQQEEQLDRLLNLSSQINTATADITALRDQLRQTQLKSKQYTNEFKIEFEKKRVTNEQRLPELRRQSLGLQDEIANAIVRSPIAGSVVELNYATNQMQIAKGTTLAVISRPLVEPLVNVTIPTSAIDQVTTGMRGVLTLSSLPQRNLPRVSAELVAIAPEVSMDSSGIPIGYKAIAKINQEELAAALSGINLNLYLSSGMPAALALEGRKMTFSQYLIAPFFKIFQGALQD